MRKKIVLGAALVAAAAGAALAGGVAYANDGARPADQLRTGAGHASGYGLPRGRRHQHTGGRPVTEAHVALEEVLFGVKRVIVGQDRLVERLVVALLADGHCLLEGVPGVAKTLAAQTLAETVGGTFSRIQFTPDLVPSDIVGTRIYRSSTESFDVELGPVMANLLLADEINRAPAKVQSALLEAMAERQVSIGGRSWPVPEPFLVLATQNPIESEGVYHLPEAQRDRFLMKVVVGYPTDEEELGILYRMSGDRPQPKQVLDPARLRELQARGPRGLRAPRDRRVRRAAGRWRPATRPGSGLPTPRPAWRTARARAPPSAWSPPPGHWPCCAAATTCCPPTSRSWPSTCSRTGWCSPSTRSPTGSRPSPSWSVCSLAVPPPRIAPDEGERAVAA